MPRFCLEPALLPPLPQLPIPHGGVRLRAGGTLTELALAELALAAAVRLALHAMRASAADRSASSSAAALLVAHPEACLPSYGVRCVAAMFAPAIWPIATIADGLVPS